MDFDDLLYYPVQLFKEQKEILNLPRPFPLYYG